MSWTARITVGFLLIVIGALAAVWGLAHYQPAARLLGVVPRTQAAAPLAAPVIAPPPVTAPAQHQGTVAVPTSEAAIEAQVADLQARVERVESQSQQAQGSAGRADALLIAFAARRAVERGVPLGYLEPLLVDRFGANHPQAVATVVTAARTPVRLSDLVADYQSLEPALIGPPPDSSWWSGVRRSFGSLISVHRAGQPSTQPQARYDLALQYLMAGEVDSALAETMRLPGASRAGPWVTKARQYIAAHRALDEIETAALLGNSQPS